MEVHRRMESAHDLRQLCVWNASQGDAQIVQECPLNSSIHTCTLAFSLKLAMKQPGDELLITVCELAPEGIAKSVFRSHPTFGEQLC
jgi:hypothetical protein